MFDLASIMLGTFQGELVSVFGSSIGWFVGHAILLAALVAVVFGIRERDHVIKHSGLGRSQAIDFGFFLLLTLSLFYFYSTVCGFASGPSLVVGVVSALFLRWMVTILG
ncbi:MAG: hypothetical protein P8Q46_06365 [Candidatus Thalassarchaeaceae archaeon]|nr:hypothetical protein [Candidatus Thalassarchaeaceae archaeon]